jgi:hypothetical protein
LVFPFKPPSIAIQRALSVATGEIVMFLDAVVERSDIPIDCDPELFLRAVCTPEGTVLSEEAIVVVVGPPLAAL